MNARRFSGTIAEQHLESHAVKCAVCKAEAVCQTLGVSVGPWGGHWVRLPAGWWQTVGLSVNEIRRGGCGGIRCPKCLSVLEPERGN